MTTQSKKLDLDELERLARAATQGGWRAGRPDMQSYDGATGEPFKNVYGPHFEPKLHHGELIPLEVARALGENCMADAQFIGAAHPEVVLSLIAAARELESRRWVPVTERTPPRGTMVLFWCHGWMKNAAPGVGQFDLAERAGLELDVFMDETQLDEDDEPRHYPVAEVAYWMAFSPPSPPEQE